MNVKDKSFELEQEAKDATFELFKFLTMNDLTFDQIDAVRQHLNTITAASYKRGLCDATDRALALVKFECNDS